MRERNTSKYVNSCEVYIGKRGFHSERQKTRKYSSGITLHKVDNKALLFTHNNCNEGSLSSIMTRTEQQRVRKLSRQQQGCGGDTYNNEKIVGCKYVYRGKNYVTLHNRGKFCTSDKNIYFYKEY